MTTLEQLILRSSHLAIEGLGDNIISELGGLESLRNLVELNLVRNRITVIQGLENLTKLKELHLT